MDGQLTVGRFDDGGEFIDVDLRALRKAATPRWRARDGEGKGVSADEVRKLLADLVDRLGWPGGNDAQDDVRFVLGLVNRLLDQQDEQRRGAEIALKRIQCEIEGIEDPEIAEQFEVLAACVAPVERVWGRS